MCCYTKSGAACARSTTDLLSVIADPGDAGSLITTKDYAGFLMYYSKQLITYTWSYTYRGRTYSGKGTYYGQVYAIEACWNKRPE